MPTLVMKNVLSGTPYPELEGTCHIVSSSGYLAEIKFEGEKSSLARLTGGGKGERNSLHAVLYGLDGMNPGKKSPLWEVSGRWTGGMTFKPCNKSSSSSSSNPEVLDASKLPTTPLELAPLSEQDPFESRRAWSKVVACIESNDYKCVAREKTKIEEAQRAFRKAETDAGKEWPRMFFRKSQEIEPDVQRLAMVIGKDMNKERQETAGVWKFIGFEAAVNVQKRGRLHEGLRPDGQDL